MKRFVSLLALALVLALISGCGGRDDDRVVPDPDVTGDVGPDGLQPDVPADAAPDQLPPDGGDSVTPDGDDAVEPGDATDTTDTTDTTDPVDEVIPCGTLTPAPGGTCSVQEGGAALRLFGTILAADKVYEGGEVLVNAGGEIVCVGCDCSNHPESDGATVVTCADGVVSPGLINAHDHLGFDHNPPGNWGDWRYDHRLEWRKGAHKISSPGGASADEMTWAELRQVLVGTTAVIGEGQADGFLRNLDKDSMPNVGVAVDGKTFPLGDQDTSGLTSGCAYPKMVDPADKLDNNCFHMHVTEGINVQARNEFLCLSSTDNGGIDLIEPNVAIVHAVGLKAIDGAEIAANSTSVIWSPRTNISLYGNTAPVPMYVRQGVRVALGTDWTITGSINLARELACADELNQRHFGGFLTDRELWLMATGYAAEAVHIDSYVGAIAPGMLADLAVYARGDGATPYRAVIEATPASTVLVLRGGDSLYGDTAVVTKLSDGKTGCEAIPGGVCGADKTLCAERETQTTFAALKTANAEAYALFFCGVPDNEPTCVPMRPGEYTGEDTATDGDGDGVPDASDNCPTVFNPVRPVDEGKQADQDTDGQGDLCDPCPTDADTTTCSTPDPDDRDGDGVANTADNCPFDKNAGQEDGDDDAKGDVCDPCPAEANPGPAACTARIYDVKQGTVAVGSAVKVSGVVTAVTGSRFFLQVPTADQDATLGARFSGVYVYATASTPTPVRGDLVELSGTIDDWYGQIELVNLTSLTVLAQGQALPAPVVVLPAAVGTGGADAQAYEAVLVTVVDGEVTDVNPAPGTADDPPTNEYVLDGALRVNDLMYLTDPFPGVGDTLTITGILRWANDNSKLEPRDAADVAAEFGLRELAPATVYLPEGAVDAPSVPPLKVRLTQPAPAGGTVVALASADATRVKVPASVTVPEGADEAVVLLTGVLASEPAVPVKVSATLQDKVVEASVLVVKGEPKPVALDPNEVSLFVGKTLELTVQLNMPALAGDVVLDVGVDVAGVLSVPEAVTVPQGAFEATFEVTALATGEAVVTVGGVDASVSATVTVTDVPQVGLVLSEVFYNPGGEDSGFEWIEIYNGTGGAVNLAGYALGWAGMSYTEAKLQLVGTLAAGECAVIGGPTSTAANFTPTFFQAVDFTPDVQNSGDKADAVALFAVPAAQISDATVPIDAVIYGGSNANSLLDETGAAGAVDIANVPSGHSLERTGSTWSDQAAPTPNDCTKVLGL